MSDLLAAVAAIVGGLFFVASAVGLLRFPDFFTRLHAPTKAATLGMLLIAGASMLADGADSSTRIEDGLLVVFLMVTLPVSAQMLARAALKRGETQAAQTRGAPPQ